MINNIEREFCLVCDKKKKKCLVQQIDTVRVTQWFEVSNIEKQIR